MSHQLITSPTHIARPFRRALSWRALLIGAVFAAAVCYFAPSSIFRFASSEITWSNLALGVVFPFTLVAVPLNILLKTINPRWALKPGELIVIFAMGMTGISIPIFIAAFWISIMSSPTYLATPENAWNHFLHPNRPDWITPSNAQGHITWFFEGLPPWYTGGIPWQTWLVPLFWWLVFLGTFYFVCFCIVVILRRQWADHERLTYPLLELPREMIRGSDGPRKLPPFMRSKLFWIGFAIPAFVLGWNIVNYFLPGWPYIEIGQRWGGNTITLARAFPPLPVNVVFPVVGFTYFANVDVSFSVWFFVILTLIEQGVCNRLGFTLGAKGPFGQGSSTIGMQTCGAFLMMVVFSLWMARGHLRAVIHQALGKRTLDDSGEPMSYRAAFWGGGGGVLFMAGWLAASGMELKALILFLPAVLLIYTGIARIVAQVGLYYFTPPMAAETLAIHAWGPSNLQPTTMISMGYQFAWHGDTQATFVQGAAQSIKLSEFELPAPRALPVAILTAGIVGFATAILTYLYYGYTIGAYNFGSWVFRTTAGTAAFDEVIGLMRAGTGPDAERYAFFGAGAVVMSLLTYLRYQCPWWPLNPVGFAVGTLWPVERHVLGIFVAWLSKVIILRLGGAPLYQASKPFFIGLILGHFTLVGVSFIVDVIWFPGQGHPIIAG